MAEVDIYRKHISHNDDWAFVRSLTHHAPSHVLPALFSEYCRAWKEGSAAEPLLHKKDNAGRAAANTLIREDAEKMRRGCRDTSEKYRRLIKHGPAQSCHTCAYSDIYGECKKGSSGPGNLCLEWKSEV